MTSQEEVGPAEGQTGGATLLLLSTPYITIPPAGARNAQLGNQSPHLTFLFMCTCKLPLHILLSPGWGRQGLGPQGESKGQIPGLTSADNQCEACE